MIVPAGHFGPTPQALADYINLQIIDFNGLNFGMAAQTPYPLFYRLQCTYNELTNTFTFSTDSGVSQLGDGAPFVLDFFMDGQNEQVAAVGAATYTTTYFIARAFGFHTQVYAGSSSYTSDFETQTAMNVDEPWTDFLQQPGPASSIGDRVTPRFEYELTSVAETPNNTSDRVTIGIRSRQTFSFFLIDDTLAPVNTIPYILTFSDLSVYSTAGRRAYATGLPRFELVYITFEAAAGNVTHTHNFITGFPWLAGAPAGGLASLVSPPFSAGPTLPPLISVFATDAVTYLNILGGDPAGAETYSGVGVLPSPVSVLPLNAAANPTGIWSIVAGGDVQGTCIATARHAAREVFNLHFPLVSPQP